MLVFSTANASIFFKYKGHQIEWKLDKSNNHEFFVTTSFNEKIKKTTTTFFQVKDFETALSNVIIENSYTYDDTKNELEDAIKKLNFWINDSKAYELYNEMNYRTIKIRRLKAKKPTFWSIWKSRQPYPHIRDIGLYNPERPLDYSLLTREQQNNVNSMKRELRESLAKWKSELAEQRHFLDLTNRQLDHHNAARDSEIRYLKLRVANLKENLKNCLKGDIVVEDTTQDILKKIRSPKRYDVSDQHHLIVSTFRKIKDRKVDVKEISSSKKSGS